MVGLQMLHERRVFLRQVMQTAWYAYRTRHIGGSNVRTFADALRNAWGFLKAKAKPAIEGATLRLRSMVQSPIRRHLTGRPYAATEAARAGYLTSMVGR